MIKKLIKGIISFIKSFISNEQNQNNNSDNTTNNEPVNDYIGTNDFEGRMFKTNPDYTDGVSVYYGGRTRRINDFVADQWRPWVAWKFQDGRLGWTYQEFTILELTVFDKDLNKNVQMLHGTSTNDSDYAKKKNWSEWLDKVFAPNKCLHAIDDCIENLKSVLGNPPFQHRVLIAIPDTITYINDWGELDGEHLDFRSAYKMILDEESYTPEILQKHQDNRKKAVRWYVDEVIRRWNNTSFKNLVLNGFLWLEEGNTHGKTTFTDPVGYYSNGVAYNATTGWDMMASTADYIHSIDCSNYTNIDNKLRINWCPYISGCGCMFGNDGHFDNIYLQSNYAIRENYTFDRVIKTLNVCSGKNMDGTERTTYPDYYCGFLFEFSNYATSELWYEEHRNQYGEDNQARKFTNQLIEMVDYFEKNNLWDRRFAHAYYDDGIFLHIIANNMTLYYTSPHQRYRDEKPSQLLIDTVDRVMKHIVERHNIAYESLPIIN